MMGPPYVIEHFSSKAKIVISISYCKLSTSMEENLLEKCYKEKNSKNGLS